MSHHPLVARFQAAKTPVERITVLEELVNRLKGMPQQEFALAVRTPGLVSVTATAMEMRGEAARHAGITLTCLLCEDVGQRAALSATPGLVDRPSSSLS